MSEEKKKISPSLIVTVVVIIVLLAALVYYATLPPKVEVVPTTVAMPTTIVQTALKTETLPGTTIVKTEERTVVQTISTTPTSTEEVKGATIRVLAVQDPFFFPLQKLLPEFEKKYGVKVILEGVAYNEVHARCVNAFLTKSPDIDVMTIDDNWIGEWTDAGWIVPLNDYIKRDKDEVNPTDFIPEVIHNIEWRGKIGAMPAASYTFLVMYRKDLINALGLKAPPSSLEDYDWWTWDVYMDYIKKMHGAKLGDTTFYGTVIVGQQPAPIVHMWTGIHYGMGGRWFESFPEAPWNFTVRIGDNIGIKAAEYYKELYKYSPPESINYFWFDAGTRFGKGDIGMFIWWSPYAYLVSKAGYMVPEESSVVGKYAVALPPHEPGKPFITSGATWGLSISAYSKHKEAAWLFIKWVSSAETQKKMALQLEPSPYQFCDFSRYSNHEDPELQRYYPWLKTQLIAFKHSMAKGVAPSIPLYFTLEGILGRHLNYILTGKETVNEAMRLVSEEFNSALTENFYIPYIRADYNDTTEAVERLLKELAS
jgi:multiple sugar transport system substrate-binding protein